MDEILKKLLESELLNEDSKRQITESFTSAVEALKENLRKEAELEVRARLVEEWTKQRDLLVEAVDEKVTAMLADEISELKEDIERFRDLEVEFSEKLVTEKHKMADKLAEELAQLVDKLDVFLEDRISEEMAELKEDLQVVRQNEFGREIFEAFQSVFNRSFVDEGSVQQQLRVAEDKLRDAEKRLTEAEGQRIVAERAQKLDEILSPLSGVKREQMALILENVEASKLSEAYNMFIGRILKEDTSTTDVKKGVLAEDTPTAPKATTVVTGDVQKSKPARRPVVESTEAKAAATAVTEAIARAQVIAGVKTK
jgi:hypothetical protein